MDEYLVQLHLLLRTVDSKMQRRAAFTDMFASALCIQHASLPRSGQSLALPSVPGNSGICVVARQMRSLFGACGGAACQDVLAAVDADAISDEHVDFAAFVAYRTAKMPGGKK